MKKICFLFLVLAATCAAAQNKDHLISMEGLGSLKLGMSGADVEKLLNKKLVMTQHYLDTLGGSYEDTAKVLYKNIPLQLEFHRSHTGPGEFIMRLIGIRLSSPLCKTASGIGVGADKLKIIAAYDNYHLNIQPGYVNYFQTEMGKGKSTVSVLDDGASLQDGSNEYRILFFLLNNKVVSFELKAHFKD